MDLHLRRGFRCSVIALADVLRPTSLFALWQGRLNAQGLPQAGAKQGQRSDLENPRRPCRAFGLRQSRPSACALAVRTGQVLCLTVDAVSAAQSLCAT
jgi:hypothetical protein